jgi:hypothetical protein
MSKPSKIYKVHTNHGAAYVLALTTLLVGVILGLAMLRSSNSYYMAEYSRQKKQAAVNLAEAGADYAYWKVHYQGQKLPYTADLTTSSGNIHIEATDDGNRAASTMLITSKGTVGKHSQKIKRVMLGPLPYHYAVCENQKLEDADAIINNNTVVGGVRTNDLINLTHSGTSITTGAWAVNTISTTGSISPRYPSSPPVLFPTIDNSNYSSIADRKYYGDTWINFPLYGFSGVIYVVGKAYVWGLYTGVNTVVSTDDLVVIGMLKGATSSSYMALLSTKRIRVANSSNEVQAIMYSHNSSNTGVVEVNDWPYITGSIATDNLTTAQNLVIAGDPRLTVGVMRQLRLPGL